MNPAYVFPHRLEELDILARALEVNPSDARAHAHLGTLLYALRRKDEALEAWRSSLALEPSAVTHRNVGRCLWKDKGDLPQARAEYERAVALAPEDHRLHADLHDILAEMGTSAKERVSLLEEAPQHGRIQARLAEALVELKHWDRAIEVMAAMQFDPYEGERGTRPAYYEAHIGRGLERYERGDLQGAMDDLEAALQYPRNVGVGRSYFAQDSKALYWAGIVAEKLGDEGKARGYWEEGASIRPLPGQVPDSPLAGYQPKARHYRVLCLQRLGRPGDAGQLF